MRILYKELRILSVTLCTVSNSSSVVIQVDHIV